MKHTALSELHIKSGAKMVEFAGYNMPVEYSGIKSEHMEVRNNAGVFDVSHMGEFWIKGENARDFIQYLTCNDVDKLVPGKIQYTCFINEKGGIIDDLLVYMIDSQTYLLVVNAANIQKDWDWCVKNSEDFNIEVGKDLYNASDEISQLAVQGPNALKIINKITDKDISDLKYYTFSKVNVAGIKDAIVSITGYTGSGGCEIYVHNNDAIKLWNAVFKAGEEFNLKPVGLGARDTLRIESGYCLYGNDIDDNTTTIHAGLGWITKLTDNNMFVGRDVIEKVKAYGPDRRLTGIMLEERGIPRKGYLIYNSEGEEIGVITSGTISPVLNKGVGLAYITNSFAKENSDIFIEIRSKRLKARVVKVPVVKI